ncbi:ankyrin repeat domain-containing protein 44 [Coprinopsis cinerea okayama7|uniref:Ankyrin repeat domain-containing protein 44 n=1 Tax=Coprinopsis cinerea (strain Okayama-7 / 130 / ATCC MYA-4618 / FGSC 9003) TaxID=240176 RepID=A8PBW1_COPC7|nr:ankyrin repeat domain-containing protein 44 [Coprinopsis cinerea okayama7\|eukprot:XP_001840280.2 ankyrin repeat domain-containing protein 44 [Coprinopsis cinerea okayama7\
MGQFLSTSGAAGGDEGKMPGTYDFENEDRPMFEQARNVNIHGGVFNRGDVHVQINNYISETSPERRRALVAKLSRWLATSVNFRTIHNDVRKRRTAGTGRWLLDTRLYREWKKSKGGIIWWMGKPGAGKTVLASTIIDDLLPLEDDSERTCVLFVYSRYTEPLAVTDVVKSLIKQCIERNHDLAGLVEPLYSKHELEGTEPSIDELVDVLQMLEGYFGRVYYVVDGVDEAHLDVRFDLIQVINKLQGNIMLTSRPLDDLAGDLKHAVFCTLAAQDHDIELHMEEKLQRYKQLRRVLDQHSCKEEILKQIIEKAEGMFLHAALQLESIQHCRSLDSVKTKLNEFPIGIQGVYVSSLQRIQSQDPESRELAMQILLWLTFARGPLSMQDMRYALAADPETGMFKPERMPDEASVLSVCCGLVERHASDIVRLIHYTAKDALVPLLLKDHPHPHIPITKVLIQRLLSSGILQAEFTELEDLHEAWEMHPLLQYAHDHLGSHTGECHASIPTVIEDFLLQSSGFPVGHWHGLEILDPPHVAAYYGLWPYFRFLADRGWSLDEKAKFQERTPLYIAAGIANELAVEHLLQLQVDPNVAMRRGWTPLMFAANEGHANIVSRLLQIPGIEVNAVDDKGRTALMFAANNGHVDIVSRLLQIPGIEVNARDDEGWTALILAASKGHVETVSRLLQIPRLDVNVVDYQGLTALMLAAGNGHGDVVSRLLLHLRINPHHRTHDHRTALIIASHFGHHAIVRALILHCDSIDVNAADLLGNTSLILASRNGHLPVVEFLLRSKGIDLDLRNNEGQTALSVAQEKGRDEIVAKLIEFQQKSRLGTETASVVSEPGGPEEDS